MTIRTRLLAGVAPVALALGLAAAPAFAQQTLTIFHNNDAESQLINAGAGALANFGGAANFAGVLAALRAAAEGSGSDTLTLTSGDNFIPSPEFAASLATGDLGSRTYYDAEFISAVQYDALAVGNHEFDLGPDLFADFINETTGTTFNGSNPIPFVTANLSFVNEPALQAQVDAGRLVPSVVVTGSSGATYGIIGATTPNLGSLSSPGDTMIDTDILGVVQTEINALLGSGVNKIVLISQLQSITEDQALISQLTGLDIAIAGGGSEVLANPGDLLVPGDTVDFSYPLVQTDAAGRDVPIVTTFGDLRYVGSLSVNFDASGELVDGSGALRPDAVNTGSGPVRVVDPASSAVQPGDFTATPDANVQANVVDPVEAFVAGLASNVIATTDDALEGRRDFVRSRETNLGNLIADAFLTIANDRAVDFGITEPIDVAITNGGGIRNNSQFAAGSNITELDTFSILPFNNLLTVVEALSVEDFKIVLENAVARIVPGTLNQIAGDGTGRFAQVAGFSFVFASKKDPLVLDISGDIVSDGDRIVEIVLDDGEVLVENGDVVSDRLLNIATLNFLANGGDQYFSHVDDLQFTSLGINDQGALLEYITDYLAGEITADLYPAGGEGRIVNVVPVPATAALFGIGALAFGLIRRRAA